MEGLLPELVDHIARFLNPPELCALETLNRAFNARPEVPRWQTIFIEAGNSVLQTKTAPHFWKKMYVDSLAVRAANQSFYDHFRDGDFEKMSKLWMDDDLIRCTHPGSHELVGREAVMQSWREILSSAAPLESRAGVVSLSEDGIAWVNVEESIRSIAICDRSNYPRLRVVTIQATNQFVRREGTWHMINHVAQMSTQKMLFHNNDDRPLI